MQIPKVVQFMRGYFPEIDRDLDLPYLFAGNIASWYSRNCSDPTVVNRMKNFFTVLSNYPEGKTAEDDLGTIVQVGIIERLWKQENAAKCLSTLFTVEALLTGSDYYKTWIGENRFNQVIADMQNLA